MSIDQDRVAEVLIKRLFVEIDGIKSIVIETLAKINQMSLDIPAESRFNGMVQHLSAFLTNLLFAPFDLVVSTSPSDALSDTKSCTIQLFGRDDSMTLQGSAILSVDTGLLLRTLLLDKSAFAVHVTNRKIFDTFFRNDAINAAVDRIGLAEYAIMITLAVANSHSLLLYYNTKIALISALLRTEDHNRMPDRLVILRGLTDYLKTRVQYATVCGAVIKLHSYEREEKRRRVTLQRDALHASWENDGAAGNRGVT